MCWKLKNYFIGRSKNQNYITNNILHNGTELNIKENGKIILNKFNDFFINVASDLRT